MCGIAGFLNFRGHDSALAREQVKAMADAIAHRGPDAEGFYTDSYAALAHRRLSIIDINSGHQPMAAQDGRFQLVFNGEIYNFLELRQELESLGYFFRTRSDTEVILKAYIQWGTDCVQHFNGMFAFALWDSEERTLFAARDRIGKKPLYYCQQDHCFAFASELKSILTLGCSKKTIDSQALDYYYTFGYVPSPLTIFSDIRKLEPGTSLIVENDTVFTRKYWSVSFDSVRRRGFAEAVEELDSLLKDAVSIRLMSEVPLGGFLSGGIDSSLVVSYMARSMNSPVLTNTVGFNEAGYNEIPVARKVADFIGADHRDFVVKPSIGEILEGLAWHFDEPFADSSAVPTWYVCKMAKTNVTVALSGDGGDESFGGYTFRYIPHFFESVIRRSVPEIFRQKVMRLIADKYPGSSGLPKALRLKTIFRNLAVSDAEAFCRDFSWLQPERKNRLYTSSFIKALNGFSPWALVESRYLAPKNQSPLARCQYTDLMFYLPEDVLVKVDRMSMAHSLELRNPLLDYRVIEFAAALPDSFKIRGRLGKRVLRHLSERYLPRSILNLPKKGFSIPASEWIKKELYETAENLIFQNSLLIRETLDQKQLAVMWREHQSGNRDHNIFLWALMMLGFWEKHYY